MTFRQPCAATMAEAKAAEMADAKTAAMAVKLPINLTSKTTFATLPPRRITEALTDVPTLMASKEAY